MDTVSQQMCGVLGSALAGALSVALAEVCTPVWAITTAEQSADSTVPAEPAEHYSLTFGERLAGQCVVAVPRADMSLLGLKSVPPGSDPVAGLEACCAALESVFLDAAARMADELQPKLGNLSTGVERVTASELSPTRGLILHLAAAEGTIAMGLFFDPQLVTALEAAHAHSLVDAVIAGVPAERNLELVMEVELSVTIRFGQRQLALREVLELASGAVVELDRQVDEPVELVLDGRVIARGEAVIIDGNYGMRVLQVMQPVLPRWVHEEV